MPERPVVVRSTAALDPSLGRLAVSVGVFDGLHLGHAYLLAALERQAAAWQAHDVHPRGAGGEVKAGVHAGVKLHAIQGGAHHLRRCMCPR